MKKVTIMLLLAYLFTGFGMKGSTPSHPTDYIYQPGSGHTKYIRTSPAPGGFSPSQPTDILPINEAFNTAAWPPSWTEQFAGDLYTSNWSINNSSYAGGTPYEAFAVDMADEGSVETDQDRLVSPPFSTAGMGSLNISFRQMFHGWSANDIWIKVQSSSDGINWIDEWSVDGSSDIAAQIKELTITNNLGGTTWIAWTLAGATYDFDIWAVDNISIFAPLAHDAEMVSIDNIPASLVFGVPVTPKATVKNFGANTETFNVTLTATDGYSSTVTGVTLSPGQQTQVTFTNWSPALGNYTLQACTIMGADMNPANDCKAQTTGCYTASWSVGASDPTLFLVGRGVSYVDHSGPSPVGYLYSIGGSGPAPQTMNQYDVALNSWTPQAPLPTGGAVQGTARVGTSIYVIGGYGTTPNVAQNLVYKYDILTNTWTSVAPLPIAIGWGKAAEYLDRYIYFAGGYGGNTNPTVYSRVYLYDTLLDTWVLATPMPSEKFGGAFSVVGNQLVYVAGSGPSSTESSVFVGTIDPGNPANITWAIKSNYPAGPMYRFDGAPWGNDGMIVSGGSPTYSPTPAIPGPTYLYKPSTDTWIKEPDLAFPVYGASTGSCNLSEGTGHTWKLILASGGSVPVTGTTQILTDELVPSAAMWNGNVDNDWNKGGNWDNGVPGSVTDVTIPTGRPNYPTLTSSGSCHNILLGSDASGTATLLDNGFLNITGTATVQRYFSGSGPGWHLVSSPVAAATANVFLGMYMQSFNEATNLYTEITLPSAFLNVMEGYGLYSTSVTNTATFTGSPNLGTKSTGFTASGSGWNLMGNPFVSSIDWESVSIPSGMSNEVHYIEASSGNDLSYVKGTGGTGSQYIPPMQGFFISATTSGTFSLGDGQRSHTGADLFYKSDDPKLVILEAAGSNYSDQTWIHFNEQAGVEHDGVYDAYKRISTSNPLLPQLYSITPSGEKLSVNGMPQSSLVPVGFTAVQSGNFTISAVQTGEFPVVTLEDLVKGTFTDLLTNSYTFTYTAGDQENRFLLHFTSLSVNENKADPIHIYSSEKFVYISVPSNKSGSVKIFNTLGQDVTEASIYDVMTKLTIDQAGVYIVQVAIDGRIYNKKVIIR